MKFTADKAKLHLALILGLFRSEWVFEIEQILQRRGMLFTLQPGNPFWNPGTLGEHLSFSGCIWHLTQDIAQGHFSRCEKSELIKFTPVQVKRWAFSQTARGLFVYLPNPHASHSCWLGAPWRVFQKATIPGLLPCRTAELKVSNFGTKLSNEHVPCNCTGLKIHLKLRNTAQGIAGPKTPPGQAGTCSPGCWRILLHPSFPLFPAQSHLGVSALPAVLWVRFGPKFLLPISTLIRSFVLSPGDDCHTTQTHVFKTSPLWSGLTEVLSNF